MVTKKKIKKREKENIEVEKILTEMDKDGDEIQKSNNKTGNLGIWGLAVTIFGLFWGILIFIGVILAIAHLILTSKGDEGRNSAVIAIVLFFLIIFFSIIIY